jgi:UDP-N-acetylmuramoyl-tripeptide--D-alanyl-D-alanine ligase
MLMQLNEINTIVGGELFGENVSINKVSIDTRTLQPDDLYLAIKGPNFNGNDFVAQAEAAGAAAVLLERDVNTSMPKIVVKDTHLALAELAKAVRQKSALPLCGITGSNGKTTVKEMIAAILTVNAETLSTQGNFNNDIGVPLTLLRLHQRHQYAVVEMGANHSGEIEYTGHIAQPDVAVITNVGEAHIEGFGDLAGVAKAKSELIQSLGEKGVAVLNADDDFFEFWQGIAGKRKVISFGLSDKADVSAVEINSRIEDKQFVTEFTLITADNAIAMQISLAGKHNVINALAAAAACMAMGVELKQIQQGLSKVKPVAGRLEPLLGEKGNIIINDSYNANPSSLKVALDVLQLCNGEPWVVLGAFGELGAESKKIHTELGGLIKSRDVVRLLAVGSDAESTTDTFGKGAFFFQTQSALIETLLNEITGKEALLIKGSRAQQMERVTEALVVEGGV